jgi:hypothetical protein
VAWREHVVLDEPKCVIGEPSATTARPCSFTNWQKSSAWIILAFVPAAVRDRDLSQPRSIHFCISSGRVCKARESENLVNHSRPVWPAMPSRCNIERTDPAGRRKFLAASSTGMVVMRSRRRCCSGFVHSRYPRFSFTPSSRKKRKHASRGFPEISVSFVTSTRLPVSLSEMVWFVRSTLVSPAVRAANSIRV